MEKQTAENIISDIVLDLTDRRGLRQDWERIDEDIQIEIFEAWQNIILKHAASQPGVEADAESCAESNRCIAYRGTGSAVCRGCKFRAA